MLQLPLAQQQEALEKAMCLEDKITQVWYEPDEEHAEPNILDNETAEFGERVGSKPASEEQENVESE